MTDIVIEVPGVGSLPAYLAETPTTDGPQPGVVVVHEAFGLNDDIRRIADEFAARGFHAVAPDLLSYAGKLRCLVSVTRAMSAGEGRPFRELEAARHWLGERDDCTGQVGIAGFCMGGAFALLMANRGFGASSVNYGRLPKRLDQAVQGACPVVASYGATDGSLRGAAARLTAALEGAAVTHDVKEYADAGHSFMNRSSVPGWMKPMVGSLNAGFVDTAAADSWNRIQHAFDTALRPVD